MTLVSKEMLMTPLYPIDIAVILRELDFPANEIAVALHKHFPTLPPLDVGQMLLNTKVYPATTRPELVTALSGAGFQTQEAELAANILYPVTVSVLADKPWQNSGVTVNTSQTTTITYLSGTWSFDPKYNDCQAEGDKAHIAQEDYTLPGQPVGALVGRVGETVFLISREASVPSGLSGELQLCINDDLKGRYGAGLTDNKGKLEVKISTRE
ncbi:hypothetical protein B5C26_05440 [Photorhabdus luminescens]|uniref:Uncharacterized protein n=1 Tax=Photorhabdus luminescens subsp. mexicana TaxID=2100167 RepID=A0A4R4JKH9_PHOLU|nr:hypothetical protein [Photorhabdus luminescens]OWO84470.1 hypothetical protein B5C26_05440 [Photorhabdus luminescens]TDB54021.1 hypothetical protein C5468_05700 [Photorhabdus luminescens subsp. mexicana]